MNRDSEHSYHGSPDQAELKLTRVLILAANPQNSSELRLADKASEIQRNFERAKIREHFLIESLWAKKPIEIYNYVMEFRPSAIHFFGTYSANETICFENENGQIQSANSDILSGLFRLLCKQVKYVFLEYCYSDAQITSISDYVDYVISIKDAIPESITSQFVSTFYESFFLGEDFEESYIIGCNSLKIVNGSLIDFPVIEKRSSISIEDIRKSIEDIRSKIHPSIKEHCGMMRILDMTHPIEIGSFYIDVNILEAITNRRRLSIDDLLKICDPDKFERFGLGQILEERLPALEAAEQHNKLMILGKPGAGKTTFLKYLAIECIDGSFNAFRVPIFVTLKSFSESTKSNDLLEYLIKYFNHHGVESEQLVNCLNYGGALILLDGLDEVKQENSGRIIQEIREFVERFYKNKFILTCRIAAKEYIFQSFTEVEIADFDERQIIDFSRKWFFQDDKKSNSFLYKIEQNKPIKEIATNPLLLTLLCLIFEETADFPNNRYELYKEGLDVLLKKWDAKRDIEREQIYKKLSLKGKEDLLGQIALATFKEGNYFIKKRHLETHILDYIQNLPDVDTDIEALQLDSEAVIKSIEAQHGLLVERARDIYSFSHLTFHEYFAAREVVLSVDPQLSLQELANHILEPRWREVILLAAEMLRRADSLLLLMKQAIDKVLDADPHLLSFFEWIDSKSSHGNKSYQTVAVRAFYFELGRIRAFRRLKVLKFSDLTNDLGLITTEVRIFDPSFTIAGNRFLELDFILSLIYSLAKDLRYSLRSSSNQNIILGEDDLDDLDNEDDLDDENDLDNEDDLDNKNDLDDEDDLGDSSIIEQFMESENDEYAESILFEDLSPGNMISEDEDLVEETYGFDYFDDSTLTSYDFLDALGYQFSTSKNDLAEYETLGLLNLAATHALHLIQSPVLKVSNEAKNSLKELIDQLPENKYNSGEKIPLQYWRSIADDWMVEFRNVIIKYFSVGYHWRFTKSQQKRINQYYESHRILIDCLNSGCYLTKEVREKIEKSLLLPETSKDETES